MVYVHKGDGPYDEELERINKLSSYGKALYYERYCRLPGELVTVGARDDG